MSDDSTLSEYKASNILLEKKLKFIFEEEHFEPPSVVGQERLQSLELFADQERIFSGGELQESDIIDKVSNLALSILLGKYEYGISFDDNDEGSRLEMSKSGRLLICNEGVMHHEAYYVDPRQTVDAVIELLQERRKLGLPEGRLTEILNLKKEPRRRLIDEDAVFSLGFEVINDWRDEAYLDRLVLSWSDDYFFASTRYSNILKEFLDTAIALLRGSDHIPAIVVFDDNNDNPSSRKPRSRYYRMFSIAVYRAKANPSVLDLYLDEEPWWTAPLVVTKDEFITAVKQMIESVEARYSEADFNRSRRQYARRLSFPARTYETFKQLLSERDSAF